MPNGTEDLWKKYKWWRPTEEPTWPVSGRVTPPQPTGETYWPAPGEGPPMNWWEMSEEEQMERYYDISKEPYPAPSGFKWAVKNYDPTTNMPTRPHWELEAAEPAAEEAKKYGGYSAEEWALGIPEFLLEKQKAEAEQKQAQRDWAMDLSKQATELQYKEQRAKEMWEAGQHAMKMAAKQQRMNVTTPSMMAGEQWRAGAYKAYEKARAEIMSQLTGEENWIRRWELEHTPNPYYQRPGIGPGEAGEAALSPAEEAMYGEYAGWSGMQPGPWAGEKTPPTPAWLAPLTGQAVGSPIKKTPAWTPSPQMWQGMTMKQKQGLAGYEEWAGGDIQDLVSRMQMMKPKRPSLGTAWRPARQRA